MSKITGNQLRSARILAGLSQAELVALAGLRNRQTLIRLEGYGPLPIAARSTTMASLLAGLGARGIALIPGGVVMAGTACAI